MSSEGSAPEPLLSYRENSLGTKREVRVHSDRVEVYGAEILAGSAQYSVELRTLNPDPIHGTFRPVYFHLGLWGILLWAVVYYVLSRIPSIHLVSREWGLFWAVPVFLIVVVVATVKPTRFANFVNDAGVAVLGVTKSYPDKRKYETFLHELSQLIRQARSQA